MNACIYIGGRNNEWIRDIFPGKSPAEMPVAGKGWVRHAVDLCSELRTERVFVADTFFYPELPKRLGDGSYWSMKLDYLAATDAAAPNALFEQFPDKLPGDGDLVIFWGQVLPDIPDIQKLFDELAPATETPEGGLPDGIYLLRGGVLNKCVCPLLRMDSIRNYFDSNMQILSHPGIYNLPGYSSEKGFGIGENVITLFGCNLKAPLVVQDNCCLGRSTVLEGGVIVGRNVLIDDFSLLKRAIILDNTYVGMHMNIEDKIVWEHTVIDVNTGAHVVLNDDFLVGHSGRRAIDRFTVAEALIALVLLILLLPSWLLARVLYKYLSERPFFKYVLKIYPNLPRVLTGHASLVRNGTRDNSYVFRFADQWVRMPDEHYRELADVYFSTHRSVRAIVMAVCGSLFKRLFMLTEPRGGDNFEAPPL